MKKTMAIALLAVFGCWSLGIAAVNPEYEKGGASLTQAGKGPRFVPGQVLLRMEPGYAPSTAARSVAARLHSPVGSGTFILDVGGGDVPAAVQALRRMPGVAAAAPNWIRQLHQGPNDAGYGYKWDLNNPGAELPLKCVNSSLTGELRSCPVPGVDIAWESVYDSLTAQGGLAGLDSVTVAVIDTGLDLVHPDLQFKIAPGGKDFVGNCDINAPSFDPATCADNDPSDPFGHGTHVAGIALGETNNGVVSAGVGFASPIKVLPLRVCDANGQCPDSALIAAIDWAGSHGANVINFSLGGPEVDPAVEAEIDAAWNAGLIVVASAGNDGTSAVSYPAAFANVIAVGSTNWEDGRAAYSNYGSALDVVAPGGEIDMGFWGMFPDDNPFAGVYSLMPTTPTYISSSYGVIWVDDDTRAPYDYTWYGWLSGTSMAAPQVSGLAALLLAVGVEDVNGNGRLNDEIRGIIEATADDLGAAGIDAYYGHGRINVERAVLAAGFPAGGGGDPPVNNPPTAAFSSTANGLTVTFTDQSSDTDGSITGWSWDFGDGNTSIARNPTHTYASGGSYSVSLTVTDDDGATDTHTAPVQAVDPPETANNPPTAAFTSTVNGLTVVFTDQSSDTDGIIEGRNWDFGDGSGTTAQNPTHTYAANGTYTVTLTVIDDDQAAVTATATVRVKKAGGSGGGGKGKNR